MLKFIDNWYIGFQNRRNAEHGVLGFMTPNGIDAAAKKRKETVDKWSSGYPRYVDGRNVYDPADTKDLPDAILSGFKIKDSISRGGSYYGSQDKWRIVDPRGFELEITSNNISIIHKYAGIHAGGEIVGKCRWAREGANNVLVPENAPEYQEAAVGAKIAASEIIQLTDDDIGKMVQMKCSLREGLYLGKYNLTPRYNAHLKVEKGLHMFLVEGNMHPNVIKEPRAVSVADREAGAPSNYEEALTHYREFKRDAIKKWNWLKDHWYICGTKTHYSNFRPHYVKIGFDLEEVPFENIKNVYDQHRPAKDKSLYDVGFIHVYENGKHIGKVYANSNLTYHLYVDVFEFSDQPRRYGYVRPTRNITSDLTYKLMKGYTFDS